jgi:hypothetical protein
MLKNLFSLYYYQYPQALVNLMWLAQFDPARYLKRINQTNNFLLPLEDPAPKTVKYLVLENLIRLGIILQIVVGIWLIIAGFNHTVVGGIFFGLALVVIYPFVWAYLTVLVLILRQWFKYGSQLDKIN